MTQSLTTPKDADLLVAERWPIYCDWLAAGNTIATASRKAFGNLSPDVLRVALGRFHRKMTAEQLEAFEQAQVQGAARMAADTLDIADELATAGYDPKEANPVQVAKLRIESRQWLASKYDRRRFGSDALAKTEVHVQLSVNDLHLQAVRELDAADAARVIEHESAPALPQDTMEPPAPLPAKISPLPAEIPADLEGLL